MSKIIGIDLGTTNSKVAVMENGHPKTLKDKNNNNSPLVPGETILLPDDKPDYTIIDPAGTDRYHVVVSASPRTSLEKLLTKASNEGLLANPESVKDEILRIRQDSSRIALDAEKPVAMGGVTRGAKPVTATQMEGKNVYVKTISIRH